MAALLAELHDPDFAFAATTTTELEIAETSITFTGNYEYAGGESRSVLVAEDGSANERIIAGGKQFQRAGDGPWFNTTGGTKAGDIGSAIAAIRELRVLGSETRAGRVLHHYATEDGALTAATLGLDRPDTSAFSGAIELFADDGGELVSVIVRANWQQANREGTAEAEASSVLEMAVTGHDPVVTAPDDPWLRFESTHHGYTIGHPEAFRVVPAAAAGDPDVFGISASEFFYVVREQQPKGTTLADYANAFVAATTSKGQPESRGSFTITRLPPGEILEYHMKINGADAYSVVGVMLDGRNGFTVSVVAQPGQEAQARAFFETLLMTFEISE